MASDLKCRVCHSRDLKQFLSLGEIPPVNAFLNSSELNQERAYPLTLAYCPSCFLVQLESIVPPEHLFSHYLHLSSGSASNIEHLRNVSEILHARFNINAHTKILEIGSNDGTLLAFFKKYTPHLLGVDPAQNLMQLSKEHAIETLPLFFNSSLALDILNNKGSFDFIIALNVIPHTPDVVNLLEGVYTLLSPHGVLVMEGVYALETILKGEFDTIYHEHVYTFSLHSLISTFKRAKLRIIDVEKIPTQGGSLRIFAQREESASTPSPTVLAILKEEKEKGLTNPLIYQDVGAKIEKFKKDLKNLIEQEKKQHGKLIGLGAPARGNVILNYCGIGTQDIEYIVDDTPLKQGKVTPGTHIPVKPWDALAHDNKQSFLLLSWNYKDSFFSKLKKQFSSSRVIIPFPHLEVISLD